MQDYIGWEGVWQVASAEHATGYNELLADVIAEGSSAAAARDAPGDSPIQEIPLRLALVGAPFAGKTAMALKVAEEHGCKVSDLPPPYCSLHVWCLQPGCASSPQSSHNHCNAVIGLVCKNASQNFAVSRTPSICAM